MLDEPNEYIVDTAPSEERKIDIDLGVVGELKAAKDTAPSHVAKGINAMLLMTKGYTCREISTSDNQVSDYVSKARKYLKDWPKSAQMMEVYAV